MFETLLIQNFQAHDKTRIDFAAGITTIVGPSDVGKSAVLRALRWVCTNEPGGDAFIRHGAKGATVRLSVDGHTVTRRRAPGGEVNEYHLDDKEFKAFGRTVPEHILRVLALGAVCWQGQHDAPYWFAETAGEVSRQLNAIVNLGVIDDVLARVAVTRNRCRTRLDVAEENLTTSKRTHDALAWVDGFAVAVGVVAGIEMDATAKRAMASSARLLCDEGHKHTIMAQNAARTAQTGVKMVEIGDVAVQKRTRAVICRELADRAGVLQQDAGVAVPDITALDLAWGLKKKLRDRGMTIQTLINNARYWETEICQTEKELKSAEAALPATCPTCGR